MPHDLILADAHVLDPSLGLDATVDIAVDDGLITAVEPQLAAGGTTQVLDLGRPGRYVLPGLVDIHTHVAHGGTTRGVGMACCVPDEIGVQSGVTTVLDAGSVGIANVGVFPEHVVPRAATRVACFLNVGTFAHTTSDPADVGRLADIDADGIARCIEHNPGLVSGLKLRLVGSFVRDAGEEVVRSATAVARANGLPLMVHVGDLLAPDGSSDRLLEITRFLLGELAPGDILTHLCTPSAGGFAEVGAELDPLLHAARARGVVLDSALGMGNFGYRVAAAQFERGLHPDTISSDLTLGGQKFHSLLECMSKFLAIGYELSDVVRMTTAGAAAAIGLAETAGSLRPGRCADITIVDLVEGEFEFTDTVRECFTGDRALVPVHTVRAGRLVAPRWGTHPWGWRPRAAGV